MFSRRLLDFTLRPFSSLQSLIRYPFVPHQQLPANSSLNASEINPDKFQQSSQQEDEPSNTNQTSGSYSRSTTSSSVVPLYTYMTLQLSKVTCLFSGSKIEKGKLANRVVLTQYPSNNPIEDRWAVLQLDAIPGYVTMVLDGHGGWQVADYAMEHLPREIDTALKDNRQRVFTDEDEYITTSIKEAFDKVEDGFLKIAREAYRIGLPQTGRVGACALVALVYGNKVYIANAGDCQGVICRDEKGKVTVRKTNHKLNANSKREQRRLREQFTDDDIFVCRRGNSRKAFYVKPTRAFGDFRLKYPEFNVPNGLNIEHGPCLRMEEFKGPYITHEPEIQIHDLESSDRYLVLSSDGMWDELSKDEVVHIVEKNINDKQKLCSSILDDALASAARRKGISEDDLRKISVGRRRKYHDDMTIIVIDLENQSI